MITEIRTTVLVGVNGSVSVQSPELHEGESAEIIVLVDREDASSPDDRIEALRQLREHMALTPEAADKWIADIREMRSSWPDRWAES